MHEYPFDVAVVRLAVIVGVVVSMLFYERLQLTTGGAIVPGYLALFIPRPLFIVVTLVTSYATFYIVNRVIARRAILYGRRKFEAEILTALSLVGVSVAVGHSLAGFSPAFLALYGIGFAIPGVIAHDMFRQTPRKTVLAVLATTGVVGLFIFVFDALAAVSPGYVRDPALTFPDIPLAYGPELILPAVVVSVVVGAVVFRRLGLRSGGFVMGAYLALVFTRPLDVLFAFAVAAVTYVVVTKWLMGRLILFGRRKLGMMVLVAAVLAWAGELAVETATGGAYVPWSGFHVITLMVPAFLANDAQRQGLWRTVWGAALTSTAVFAAMSLVQAGLAASR